MAAYNVRCMASIDESYLRRLWMLGLRPERPKLNSADPYSGLTQTGACVPVKIPLRAYTPSSLLFILLLFLSASITGTLSVRRNAVPYFLVAVLEGQSPFAFT